MSANLPILTSYSLLNSDKVTERKRASRELRDYIDNEAVCKKIDNGEAAQVTWEVLFSQVHDYIWRELEHFVKFEKGNKVVSDQMKRDVAETMRRFLKVALNRKRKTIKIKDVLKHVINIIHNPALSLFLLKDYSYMLLNDILTCHQYMVDVSHGMWTDLLQFYCGSFKSPGPLSCDVIARLIDSIITQSNTLCDIDINMLYMFFDKNFKMAIKNYDSKGSVVEPLLTALNKYCKVAAPNSRGRLCRLGENDCVCSLINIWDKSSVSMKHQIVEFLWTQMKLHHPKGSCEESKGSWAYNDQKWAVCIEKMHRLILKELNSSVKSLKWTNSGTGFMSPLFIDLAVDVIYQIYHIERNNTRLQEPRTKRRRLSPTISRLAQHLLECDKLARLTWLQVLSHMTLKWSREFTSSELCSLLVELHKILKDVSLAEYTHWLLVCLKSVAIACSKAPLTSELKDVWKMVWDTCLRLKLCREDLFKLLTIISENSLVPVDNEPWKVIFSCKPTRSVIVFMSSLLVHHEIPESFSPMTLLIPSSEHQRTATQFPLRTSLLQFMIPLSDPLQNDGSDPQVLKTENRPSPLLLAQVLTALTEQTTSNIDYACQQSCKWIIPEYQSHLEEVASFWSDIESVYLLSSLLTHPLTHPLGVIKQTEESCKTSHIRTILIRPLCQYLYSLIDEQSRQLLDRITQVDKVNSLCDVMESMAYHFSLTVHIASLLHRRYFKNINVCNTPAASRIQDLLKAIYKGLKSSLWNEINLNQHDKLLMSIVKQFTQLLQNSQKFESIRKLLLAHFPPELLGIIHQLAQCKYELIKESSYRNNNNSSDDFDTMEFTSTRQRDSFSPLSASSSIFSFSQSGLEIFDPAVLDQPSLLQKEACEFIIHWCMIGKGCGNTTIDSTWNVIDQILQTEELTSTKTLHILFFVCGTIANVFNDQLEEDLLNTVLDTIRRMLSSNRKNQVVYQHCLRLLGTLAKSTSNTEDRHISKQFLSLLSAFCNLYYESALTATVRCSLADTLMKTYNYFPLNVDLDTREGEVSIDKFLLSMLCDPHHCVCMKMVPIVCGLFYNDRESLVPVTQQEAMFTDEIYPQLDKANQLDSGLHPMSIEDESVNRIFSKMSLLVGVASTSVSCERHVISRMICDVGKRKIDSSLVMKAIHNISEYLKYSSHLVYLEEMVSYLVMSWLKEGTIHDFPYIVYEESSLQSFLRKYYQPLVPHVLWSSSNTDLLQLISTECGLSLSQMYQNCLPVCMVFIITVLSDQNNEGTDTRAHATSCYDHLTATIGQELLEDTMIHRLKDVVVELLVRLFVSFDSSSFLSKYMSPSDPCPFIHHYSTEVVLRTLDYLPSCYSANQHSFVSTITKKKDMIQCILLSLNQKLYSTHRIFHRKNTLMSYSLFVRLLCQHLGTGLGGSLEYVVMDIIYSMIRVLRHHQTHNEDMKSLFPLVCDTLECLLKAVFNDAKANEVLVPHYQIIFNELLLIARTNSDDGKQALSLLKYFLHHGDKNTLTSLVTMTDPLPDEGRFHDLRTVMDALKSSDGLCLGEELVWFSSMNKTQLCPDGLDHVHGVIVTRRNVINNMLVKRDPYIDNPVVEFIQSLMSLSEKSVLMSDRQSITMISRCLGDIGFMDIPCIALPTRGDIGQKSMCEIYNLLLEFLTDSDIDVVKETCDCLKALLSTQKGSSLLSEQEKSCKLNILEPFKRSKKSGISGQRAASTAADSLLSWTPISSSSHNEWLTQLVLNLLQSGWVTNDVLLLLRPVCKVKPDLCQWVFPLVVHDILSSGINIYKSLLSIEVNSLFSVFNNHDVGGETSVMSAASVHTILDMLMYLRTQRRPGNNHSLWDSNFWLEVDLLAVSEAAIGCSSYFVALLYLEIWYHHQMDLVYDREACGEINVPHPVDNNPSVKSQLLRVYDNIKEPDSLYGAIILYSPQEELRKRLYEHEGQWDKALSVHNWQSLLNSDLQHSHLAEIFKNLGLPQVLDMYVEGVKATDTSQMNELREFQYEAAWKYMTTQNWLDYSTTTTPMSTDCNQSSRGFHSSVNGCLFAIEQNEQQMFDCCLYSSRVKLLSELCSTSSNQSVCRLYPHLTKLQCLQELEDFGKLLFSNNSEGIRDLFVNWESRLSLMGTDFQYTDLVLSLRAACVHSLLKSNRSSLTLSDNELHLELHNVLGSSAKRAREAGNYQVAEASFFTLKNMNATIASTNQNLRYKGQLEEAQLCWARGEHTLALMIMDKLINMIENTNESSVSSIYALSLCHYGNWLAETKSQNPLVILETYLQKAVDLLEELSHDHLIEGYLTLARFADSQYKSLARQMETKRHEAKRQLVMDTKKDLEKIIIKTGTDRTVKRHYHQLKMQSSEDELVIIQQMLDQKQFLEIALTNYIKCLKAGDEHNLRIFRVCSLWFNNSDDDGITSIIQDNIPQLPSMKFIPLLYQLAARMSCNTNDDPFQNVLQQLLLKICTDHPHHSLYIIHALSNASLDNEFPQLNYVTGTRSMGAAGGLPSSVKRSKRSSLSSSAASVDMKSVDEDKKQAAQCLINQLQYHHPQLVKTISRVCEAYVDLAYHDVTKYRNSKDPIKMPSSCPLLKTSPLSVPMATIDIPVDPTCQYSNVVTIEKFDRYISLCGGVNLPKVISCLGSDGVKRRQLIKGRDDLRQDAVMQQVFGLVNQLLVKKSSTAKRKLSIRTYKVIPLSQCSGIVEWCEGTIPIGEYLIGTSSNPSIGAHARYRPKDWPGMECRRKFASIEKKEQKRKTYDEICRHFKPVFHHFFMENFLSPSLWFERRLAYTRCVAASSIVCYIVGLGDRHIHNILVDKKTAELIHIDLGVAFEQGKTLPTPELVPFRLTRDLVDGMGVTSVNGVFKRCCEETMTVMRSSNEELKTIVEVLLYDPLYLWNISPHKVQALQGKKKSGGIGNGGGPSSSKGDIANIREDSNSSSSSSSFSNGNRMAERVLIRLQEKLEGIEDGTLLSVSGQISHLIQEATDPQNLSALFHGWQPWI